MESKNKGCLLNGGQDGELSPYETLITSGAT